jgi:hypothetical protein
LLGSSRAFDPSRRSFAEKSRSNWSARRREVIYLACHRTPLSVRKVAQVSTSDTSPANHGGLLDGYMTTEQLAAELKVSPRTIARWDRLRCGPPIVRIGRRKLRPRDGVSAWLKSRQQDFADRAAA